MGHIYPEDYIRLCEDAIRAEALAASGDAVVFLRLSEYEASILTGALLSFDPEGYPGDGATAYELARRANDQLPTEWWPS